MKMTFWILMFSVQVLLLMGSCKKLGLCMDAEFKLPRRENTSNRLRLTGFFYANLLGLDPESPNIYFLYQNGVFYNNYSSNLKDIISGKAQFDNSDLRKKYKNSWGIYKIENNIIEIQYWAPTLRSCDVLIIEKGEILNDSTFTITLREDSRDREVQIVNAVYHFHPYSPKPDSIVNFIK